MTGADQTRYVFCVNPGRSGSYFLSEVFGLLPGVCSVHEPEHQFGKYAALKPHNWNLRNQPLSESFKDRSVLKHWQIQDVLTSRNARTYVETNPLFGTLWHDVVLGQATTPDICVIVLRRNPVDVLKSLLDLGWYSARDGDSWMLSAYSVNSLFEPPWQESEATAADLVIGHLINVELCAKKIAEVCATRGFKLVEARAQDLFSDLYAIEDLVRKCGLPMGEENLIALSNLGKNKKNLKSKEGNVSLSVCAKRFDDFLSACDAAVSGLPFARA